MSIIRSFVKPINIVVRDTNLGLEWDLLDYAKSQTVGKGGQFLFAMLL